MGNKVIPFLDLKAVNGRHRQQFQEALDWILASGIVLRGEETERFENAFANYCQVKHCVGVSNGLDALKLVLQAWGIGCGDEVIVPAHTFIATWLAVMQVGARPVPIDVGERSFNIDTALIESAITSRTKVIIPVHLYGHPADMSPIVGIAEKYGILILEDAAQAHGARYHSKRVGCLGHAAAFSFYPGKNLGALGDAGAITTNDSKLAAKVRSLANYGATNKYQHVDFGGNSRMDEIQAAFLSVKLGFLDADNDRRRVIADKYAAGLPKINGLILPTEILGNEAVWHLYVIRHPNREAISRKLSQSGIGTLIHYPIPPHLQPACSSIGYTRGTFPISEKIAGDVLSLPMGPTLSDEEVDEIIQVMANCAFRETLNK